MFVEIDSTTVVNALQVTYISKISDTKVSVHFTNGSSIYVYKPMREVVELLDPPVDMSSFGLLTEGE